MSSLLMLITLVPLALASPLDVDTYHQQEVVKPHLRYEQETASPVPYSQQETVVPHPRYEQGSASPETYNQYDFNPEPYYFERVGIPLAKAIYEAEQAMMLKKKGDKLNERIIGGAINPVGVTKFLGGILSLLTDGRRGVCGCSLLSPTRAVTAAHCWYDGRHQATKYDIRYGSPFLHSEGVKVETSNVTMHENYDFRRLMNDIAMIVQPSVEYSDVISNINLPTDDMINDAFVDKWCLSAGYGRNATNKSGDIIWNQPQRIVNLQVISNKDCRKAFGRSIYDSSICTRDGPADSPVGTCQGDSGGPLYCTTENAFTFLAGIVSWGDEICEIKPAVFTRVTSFIGWINNRM